MYSKENYNEINVGLQAEFHGLQSPLTVKVIYRVTKINGTFAHVKLEGARGGHLYGRWAPGRCINAMRSRRWEPLAGLLDGTDTEAFTYRRAVTEALKHGVIDGMDDHGFTVSSIGARIDESNDQLKWNILNRVLVPFRAEHRYIEKEKLFAVLKKLQV